MQAFCTQAIKFSEHVKPIWPLNKKDTTPPPSPQAGIQCCLWLRRVLNIFYASILEIYFVNIQFLVMAHFIWTKKVLQKDMCSVVYTFPKLWPSCFHACALIFRRMGSAKAGYQCSYFVSLCAEGWERWANVVLLDILFSRGQPCPVTLYSC